MLRGPKTSHHHKSMGHSLRAFTRWVVSAALGSCAATRGLKMSEYGCVWAFGKRLVHPVTDSTALPHESCAAVGIPSLWLTPSFPAYALVSPVLSPTTVYHLFAQTPVV